MSTRITKGQGTLKFDNNEIFLLLKENDWSCSSCDNPIKNEKFENPFSSSERENPKWVVDAEKFSLQEFKDINVKRKKPRGTKGNNARSYGELNYDNLLLLCYLCNKKRLKERREQITFRTSIDKKEWLESLTKDKELKMAELMNKIIDEYIKNNPDLASDNSVVET
jgi:hypothetical protein|tara:strand:- start:46 stop:546 length:501 start_codon:yes stop_codon:yes gene_type:complete